MDDYLVAGLEHFFPILLGMSSSQLTFIFFRGIETTNQCLDFIVPTMSPFFPMPKHQDMSGACYWLLVTGT